MFFAGRRDFLFGLLLLYQAPRGCGFEPVLTESGYVHRSEDVCYRVQLSLHLLSKAIVFCEDCTKLLQVEEASTMTDILLPASQLLHSFSSSRASQLHQKGAKQLSSALSLDE